MTFLSIRFYVKPTLKNLENLKLPFFAILRALNFVILVNFSLQKVQKLKIKASKCVKLADFALLESPKFDFT